jgi:hypothetical protein
MDYRMCKALSYNIEGIPVALVMYDIMCQYSIHFKKRVKHQSRALCFKLLGNPEWNRTLPHPWTSGFLLTLVFTQLHSRSEAV